MNLHANKHLRCSALRAATLLALAVAACACALGDRTQDPALGNSKSAILDEKGQVVGTGPALAVVGPGQPGGTAAKPDDPLVAAQYWFAGFLDNFAVLERDMAKIKTVLRANWIAVRELEADLAADKVTLAAAKTEQLRSYLTLLVNAKEQKLGELRREQNALLRSALERWSDFVQCLSDKTADCAALPSVQKALTGFGKFLAQRHLVGEMELNLCAGKSPEFRALAGKAQGDPALQAVTLHFRVQDYLDRGDMGLALHAARVGADRYKNSELGGSLSTQAQSLEVSFLKLISSKAETSAADVRRTWEKYAGEVSDSTIKQVLFGSVRHGIDSLLGRANELRDLAADSQTRLVLEHNGIELAWRLREKGFGIEEIRLMTPEKLQAAWGRISSKPIGSDSAEAMSLSLHAAFRNDDVKKLAFSRDETQIDFRPTWMGQSEFDAGMFGTCVDAVNVKNVLLLCGPGTVVSSGGTSAGLGARFAKTFGRGSGAWERIGAAAETGLKDAITARDWLASTPALKETARFLAETGTGKALRDGLNTWCAARYQGPAAVRAVMGAEEVLAQIVVFEAGGKVGKAIGGDYGEFLGQALAVLAGNPVHDFQQGRTGAIKAQVKDFRQRLTAAEAAAARARAAQETVEAATAKVRGGQSLAEAEAAQVRRAGQDAGQAAAEVQAAEQRIAQAAAEPSPVGEVPVQSGTSRVTQSVREHADLVAAQAEAVAAGERVGTELVAVRAKKAGTVVNKALDDAKRAADALDRAGARQPVSPTPGAPEPGPGGSPTEVAGAQTAAEMTCRPKMTGPAPAPSGEAIPTQGPRPPSTHAEAYELGEEAMRSGDFAAARSHYRTASQFEQIAADDAALYTKRMREAEHSERFAAAMSERRASGKFEGYSKQCDDAMRDWTPAELDSIGKMKLDDLPLVSAATGKAETAAAPRLVLDAQGRKVGIFKEAPIAGDLQGMQQDGNLVNEIVVSRMYREFGLRAPAAAEVILQGASGPVRGVIVRWIPGCRQLEDLSAGARAALAPQVAPFKAASIYAGNYDVHMGNFVYDQTGRVWHIDYGMACLKNSFGNDGMQFIRDRIMQMPTYRLDGAPELDFARLMRDLYRDGAQAKAKVVELDRLLRGSDMRPVVSKIRRVQPADIDRWLTGVIKRDTPQEAEEVAQAIKDSLAERKRNIEELVKPWPSAMPAPTPGPQARFHPRAIWQVFAECLDALDAGIVLPWRVAVGAARILGQGHAACAAGRAW